MGNYWWQNAVLRHKITGETILKFTGEGCQARNEFDWAGKVIGFEKDERLGCNSILIEVIIHNFSYADARDNDKVEIYKYPLVNADIQNVKGVWILFT